MRSILAGLERGARLIQSGSHAESPAMSIAQNRKAYHDYFIEEKYEAGLVLEGWEVKAIRAGQVHLSEAYVILKSGTPYLIGCHITPLITASTHVQPDPTRTRKLLLKAEELRRLIGKVERAGYALVPLDLHYRGGWIKLEIGLAKGKKQHDKRQAEKERDWQREKQRLLRQRA
ncbi:MAG TPA: SsrA-binding protein SmpB [Burkholderiales bacterium]|nr:SsrA-binding protein SmpB [Burkholderiales bacterium]